MTFVHWTSSKVRDDESSDFLLERIFKRRTKKVKKSKEVKMEKFVFLLFFVRVQNTRKKHLIVNGEIDCDYMGKVWEKVWKFLWTLETERTTQKICSNFFLSFFPSFLARFYSLHFLAQWIFTRKYTMMLWSVVE
jgi:hypothetical protein